MNGHCGYRQASFNYKNTHKPKTCSCFQTRFSMGSSHSLGKAVDVLFWALSLKVKSSKPKKTQKDGCAFLVRYISLKVNM